jgi:predicted RNA polymerase sigma factor
MLQLKPLGQFVWPTDRLRAARSGDVTGAENALGDAFVKALERWPVDGIPQKPEAWLLHVARNRTIDVARRKQGRKIPRGFSDKSPRKRRPSRRRTNISPTSG